MLDLPVLPAAGGVPTVRLLLIGTALENPGIPAGVAPAARLLLLLSHGNCSRLLHLCRSIFVKVMVVSIATVGIKCHSSRLRGRDGRAAEEAEQGDHGW